MLALAAPVALLALSAFCVLASTGAPASRNPAPDVVSVETYPFSAVVKWSVPDTARVVLEVGVDDRYGIWSPTTAARGALTARTTLAGLEPATTYRFRVVARWRTGLTAEARGAFRTDPWPGSTAAIRTGVDFSAMRKTSTLRTGAAVISPSRSRRIASEALSLTRSAGIARATSDARLTTSSSRSR